MKSNYFNATKIVEVILNDAIKTFDVTIRINGETYHVPTTYNVVDDAINLNFAELPELSDKEYQVICDKITDKIISVESLESEKETSPATKDLANSVRTWIIENVDNDDMEQYRWWLNIKHPSIEDIAKILNELANY